MALTFGLCLIGNPLFRLMSLLDCNMLSIHGRPRRLESRTEACGNVVSKCIRLRLELKMQLSSTWLRRKSIVSSSYAQRWELTPERQSLVTSNMWTYLHTDTTWAIWAFDPWHCHIQAEVSSRESTVQKLDCSVHEFSLLPREWTGKINHC